MKNRFRLSGTTGSDDIAQLLEKHRELVLEIKYKERLFETLSLQRDNFGGSIIEELRGEKADLGEKVSTLVDLKDEIEKMQEERKESEAVLQVPIKQYCSILQRQILDAHYFHALPWADIAVLIYGENKSNHRRSCQDNRKNGIKAIRDKSKR